MLRGSMREACHVISNLLRLWGCSGNAVGGVQFWAGGMSHRQRQPIQPQPRLGMRQVTWTSESGSLMTQCRLCGSTDLAGVVDLGATPPCERFLTADQLEEPEITYPLHLQVCTSCWLAQIPPLITP